MSDRDGAGGVGGWMCALAAIGAGVIWLGAQLAAGIFGHGFFPITAVGFGRALRGLVKHPGEPAAAWPEPARAALPGPTAYWVSTMLAAAVVVVVVAVASRWWHQKLGGSERPRRLGVETAARFARTRDLRPLIVPTPTPGRFVLGRVGRHLVATEDRTQPIPTRSRLLGAKPRRGDRGSVAIVGPTRSGKTVGVISGVLDWMGPAILSSVKTDLMAATIRWRRTLGEVRVFDPTAATSEPGAGWSPLRSATSITGAQKAAHALVEAGPRGGSENLEFFLRLGEQLLWPHLYLAAVSALTIGDVVRWMLVQDRPKPKDANSGEVWPLLEAQHEHRDPTRRRAALDVEAALRATWALDDRARSSTYATAQTLLAPWADPTVATSGQRQEIDVEWLVSGPNTLYICAPLHEQARLGPVFGGLLGDLVNQAYERVNRTHTPLPPTLMVMDEAGNTPTRWLPQVASTCAGMGLLLVTVWQSKAQLDAAYGRLADSVLTNHVTKIFFSGISDPSTLEYAAGLLGDEDIIRRQISTDLGGGGRRSVSEATHPTRLVPAHALRQVRPGEALLIHATLPPAHLRSRRYYLDRRLRGRAGAETRTTR